MKCKWDRNFAENIVKGHLLIINWEDKMFWRRKKKGGEGVKRKEVSKED
jgi:hypothetical protein